MLARTKKRYANAKTIGSRAETIRERNDISRRDLAVALGFSVSTIHSFERGNHLASWPLIRSYCEYFGIDSNWLLGLPEKD